MVKVKYDSLCDCMYRLINVGLLCEYSNDKILSNYTGECSVGQICIKTDRIIDYGEYDEFGNYNTNYQADSVFFPIDYCPICGKRIEYELLTEKMYKLERK